MSPFCLIGLFCVVCSVNANPASLKRKTYPAGVFEDADLDTEQLIRKYNYPAETHFVTTDDGYIIRVHRIVNPGGIPILLQHGLMDSSATYILTGPTHSLGYYLHDKGYDVWLGNARGNRYSRNHTKLNPNTDGEFWNFSWHEIGIFDIPAMVDYILNETNSTKLFYVGHSQGTTAFFVMCSMKPIYNEKIILAHALAPVAYLKHIRSPLIPLAQNSLLNNPAINSIPELLPHSNLFQKICLSMKQMEDLCLNLVFVLMGSNPEQFNRTMLPTLLGHVPAGASTKQVLHYAQLIKSGRFCQFDYKLNNQRIYGQSKPPEYELQKVTAPVALYYSLNDNLSDAVDSRRLSKRLPNQVNVYRKELENWNHMDFLYAINARNLLFKRIHKLNEKYRSVK